MLAVVYATDNGYAPHMAVSLHSLLTHNTDTGQYEIYVLANNLSAQNQSKINAVAKGFGTEVYLIDISDIASLLPAGIDTANLTLSTYCRLFVSELLPKSHDRVLYLDCDTLICGDVLHLEQYVSKHPNWCVAGVEDTMYPHMKLGIGLAEDSLYINAGILYINLARWCELDITDRFLRFIDSHGGAVPHLDQGVINGVFSGKGEKVRLPLRYNMQAPVYAIHSYKRLLQFFSLSDFYSPSEIMDAKASPTIIHYTSFFVERPWFEFCLHPLRHCYHKHLALTPYRGLKRQKGISISTRVRDLAFRYFQPIYFLLKRCKK